MKTNILDLNKDIINSRAANIGIGVIFFVLATALGAYVRIPVAGSPVPITLQTLFVLLSGAILGRRFGSFAQFAYSVLGIIGLPILQGCGFGMAYLMGPTTGYLAGFIFAAYVVGRILSDKAAGMVKIVLSFAVGSLIILAFGASWLVLSYKMNISNAISAGILPFIPGDIAKVAFASIIYSKISKRSKNVFSV